jgi:hypothetical protein
MSNKENEKHPWAPFEIEFLIRNSKLKDEILAKHLNRSINSIRNKRRRLGINKKYKTKYSINLSFFKIWSNDMAYILGYIYADGYVRIQKNKGELSIKSKDFEILEQMNIIMKSEYPITEEDTNTGIIYRLSIYQSEFIRDLLNLGLTTKKSLTMEFPYIPEPYIFHFIRGYFDGDGHVRIIGNSLEISFTSGSEKFLKGLKKKLTDFKIPVRIWSPSNYSFYNLKIYKEKRDYFVFMLYKDADIFLKRKKLIFQNYYTNYNIVKIICIDCGREVRKTGKNQKRCKICSKIKY